MSDRRTLLQTLERMPNSSAKAVHDALPADAGGDPTKIAAQLYGLCMGGYARRHKAIGARAYLYVVTGKNAARTRKRAEARAAKRLSDDQKRAGYTSAKALPPKPSSNIRIVKPPRPKAPCVLPGQTETVAAFQARGGIVQQLAPHECSGGAHGLRFDHSDTRTPIARRRAIRRPRPYAPHA